MNLKEWFRRQVAAATFAISNVEKNVLSQEGRTADDTINQERRHSQGTLAEALVHGELTQEVRDLRWRTYKVIQASQNMGYKFNVKLDADGEIVLDEDGNMVFEENNDGSFGNLTNNYRKYLLSRVKIDTQDDYELEMVFDNSEVTVSITDRINQFFGDKQEIKSNAYFATNKTERPLKIQREFMPKFEIENYTKKLNIRKIDENKRLLEFYVSKYGDEFNPNFKHFIREIKRVMVGEAKNFNFLEIKEVGFVSEKTLGSDDFLLYTYNIVSFDKIIEFDGYYVVKFIGEITSNGENIVAQYVEKDLEERYANKEAKKYDI